MSDIRDAKLKGYGVRVMPSGAKRYFIHSQHRGKRVWKIIGDATMIAEPEARATGPGRCSPRCATPAAANRSAPILSVIMQQAAL